MKAIPAAVQRWAAFLLPPLSILVCCIVMVPRQNKLRQVHREIQTARASVQHYLQQLEAIRSLPPDPVVATLPMTEEEQSDFLRGLSTLCSRSGNHILSVASLGAAPPPPPPPPGSPPPVNSEGALPPGVVGIKSTIMFQGSFKSLRTFLNGLKASRRLISMAECRIGAGEGGFPNLQTTLTVTRYVDAPAAPATAPPAGAKTAAANTGGPAS